jgi:hypothetical protein
MGLADRNAFTVQCSFRHSVSAFFDHLSSTFTMSHSSFMLDPLPSRSPQNLPAYFRSVQLSLCAPLLQQESFRRECHDWRHLKLLGVSSRRLPSSARHRSYAYQFLASIDWELQLSGSARYLRSIQARHESHHSVANRQRHTKKQMCPSSIDQGPHGACRDRTKESSGDA